MKILITGAGGAAAVSVWKSLNSEHELYMADIDPCAAGLYLVPPQRRKIIPSGTSATFLSELLKICQKHEIELLIPTVDAELLPIALHKEQFTQHGIRVPLSSSHSLELCRDKYKLLEYCKDTGLIPSFQILTKETLVVDYPLFAKPRLGSGGHGAMVIENDESFELLPKDGSYIIQELLSGDEYSVDTYVQRNGCPIVAVPRLRMKIDSGIAVASQTKNHPLLIEYALTIIKKVRITYVANVQFKANAKGEFKLLEINPRFPGTLPLTAAAGIDIPKLLIQDVMGLPLSNALLPFKELMVVRYWTEQFIEINEWNSLCLR